jgi:hypothetical protein
VGPAGFEPATKACLVFILRYPDGFPIARPGANVIYVDAEAVPQIQLERASHYNMGMEQGFSRSMIFRSRRELALHITNTKGHQAPDNAWKWSDRTTPGDDPLENEE